ncbi:MAG: IclR family transcriptional regulator [Limnohabitans sp.]|nr:IclR family transcriptional regulator [Limnohabitans sp.]
MLPLFRRRASTVSIISIQRKSFEIIGMSLAPLPLDHEGPIARGAALLRLMATAGRRGMALTAMSDITGLPNSTVHRLLAQLVRQRLAVQLDASRRYAIGPLAYELGLSAAQQFDVRQVCRPAMEKLATDTAETVYLVQRSGLEAVCIDLVPGPSAVRVLTLQVGSRRPLGLGAGGLAILATLDDDEREDVFSRVMGQIESEWRFAPQELRESMARARLAHDAVIRNRITPGVTAMGRSFKDSLGQVLGAVTVAGVNARMTESRMSQHRQHLLAATRAIEKALRGQQWARYASDV